MTELLYMDDSYLQEFEAMVTEVQPDAVALDRTAFYPGGGGQPHDTGLLIWDGVERTVTKVKKQGQNVWHWLDGEPPPAGASVTGRLDWERRYKLMRTHTALHILCGVIWRDYGASVTGGNMKPGSARMDFELESMSIDFAETVEKKINEEVTAARPVDWRELPREEAFQIPDLIRTKIDLLPPQIKKVRVVEIGGLDLQADGGTHVRNTREVGRIKVVGHTSKGRINKRLRIAL
ncbi:MAG: Ala-tRNA(Pro) hydrolase [Anaerolineaceae bacterium 4572_32.1]|nr:MAG: Ala-tRNA(Pro) hydrolase [Anaerolineaceae bacterium 4572_32.1]